MKKKELLTLAFTFLSTTIGLTLWNEKDYKKIAEKRTLDEERTKEHNDKILKQPREDIKESEKKEQTK